MIKIVRGWLVPVFCIVMGLAVFFANAYVVHRYTGIVFISGGDVDACAIVLIEFVITYVGLYLFGIAVKYFDGIGGDN